MTLPRIDRRSTAAAERRQQREDYAALKARVAASPETAERRARHRRDDQRHNALKKMTAALSGKGSTCFSAKMLAQLKPAEHKQLMEYSSGRFRQLDADQRRRLSANLYVILATVPTETYMAVANMLPLGEAPAA